MEGAQGEVLQSMVLDGAGVWRTPNDDIDALPGGVLLGGSIYSIYFSSLIQKVLLEMTS